MKHVTAKDLRLMARWNERKNSLPIGKSTFGGWVDASDYISGILTVSTDEIELLGATS